MLLGVSTLVTFSDIKLEDLPEKHQEQRGNDSSFLCLFLFALAHLDHEAHAAIQILIVWRGFWISFPLFELGGFGLAD